MGGVQRLVRHVGQKQAMQMLLTAEPITAQRALDLGIINKVVKPEDLRSAAKHVAEKIMSCSPTSIKATKAMVQQGLDQPTLQLAIETMYDEVKALFVSEDFVEGPLAFAQKRAPHWKGR
jgi:enoyl-CoA hydratase/carnithine racemase